jgi:hypothetical protein
MSYVEAILRSAPDPTSAALDIHCIIEQVDEAARTSSETTVARVMRLAGQIANGGFDQYFFNSGVWSARDALHDLRRIGADDVAVLMQTAIELVGLPDLVPDDYRYDPPEVAVKALRELDDRFYSVDDALYEKVTMFARSNESDFGFQNGT